MSLSVPQFELTRVLSNGTQENPEIVQITGLPWETKADRRGFLGAGIGASLLMALLKGGALANALPLEQTSAVPATGGSTAGPDCNGCRAYSGGVSWLAISPDGKLLVSAGGEGSIKLWSLPGGTLLKKLQGHKGHLEHLAITPDGKILASAAG